MTDHEHPDDAWAGRIFDRARTSFDEPQWVPDAVGAARASNRRRRWNRAGGAAGLAAVVGLSASVYATLGGSHAATVGPGSKGTPTSSLHNTPSKKTSPVTGAPISQHDRELAADLAEYMRVSPGGGPIGGDFSSAGKADDIRIPEAAAESITSLITSLDPSGAHLRQPGDPEDHETPVVGPPSGKWEVGQVNAAALWTPNGDGAKPFHQRTDAEAYGQVNIHVDNDARYPLPNTPCEAWVDGLDVDTGVSWSPCQKRQLSDGSYIVTAHSTNLGDKRMVTAKRVYPDGTGITVSLVNWLTYASDHYHPGSPMLQTGDLFHAGKPIQPLPWTDQQLSDALSAPGIQGLN